MVNKQIVFFSQQETNDKLDCNNALKRIENKTVPIITQASAKAASQLTRNCLQGQTLQQRIRYCIMCCAIQSYPITSSPIIANSCLFCNKEILHFAIHEILHSVCMLWNIHFTFWSIKFYTFFVVNQILHCAIHENLNSDFGTQDLHFYPSNFILFKNQILHCVMHENLHNAKSVNLFAKWSQNLQSWKCKFWSREQNLQSKFMVDVY